MRRVIALAICAVLVGAIVPAALATSLEEYSNGTTYVKVTDTSVTVGNDLVERSWSRAGWTTASFGDKRNLNGITGGSTPDFTLDIGTQTLSSDRFEATGVAVTQIEGGLRADVTLKPASGPQPVFTVTRTIEIYEGIAGVRLQNTINTVDPLVLRGYSLEQSNVGTDVTPTIHAFRAGADWREPNWQGPCDGRCTIGDPHAGTWRDTDTVDRPGENIAGPAQWLSVKQGDHSLFMVMERNDWPSSRAAYTDGLAKLNVDYSADVVILGPLEENAHVENPHAGEAPGRHRVIPPSTSLALESVFVGFGVHSDDEPWQFYKYLSGHRMAPFDNSVTFNSNGTDNNMISTGAKDDMHFAVVQEVAPLAKRLGVETFILDDGWQAQSGDWFPDCPGHRDWRSIYDPKFIQRFPDCEFTAVKETIAPMELGLWMNAMHFHPMSETYRENPHWSCKPTGDATAALNMGQPSTQPRPPWDSSSNEAGIGTWGTLAIPHIEERIRIAIDDWGARYFKFDFLVWLDCAESGSMYDYKEAFMAMVDRISSDHSDVTFQIDETNDYRLFPFESVTRGPSWFQNGSPPPHRLLHNLWNLAPYVPTYTLGQHFLGGRQYENYPIATLMAVALPGHLTFFSDLREVPVAVLDQARPWVDFYKHNRDHFTQMAYPLLADPMDQTWTALQTWNPESGKGALLAFRQNSADPSRTIGLRNVPDGMMFDLFEAPTGEKVGTVTSAELRAGIDIAIPNRNGARVLLIEPAAEDPFDPTTSLAYVGDVSARIGGPLTLAAKLTGDDGAIVGAPLTFSFRGETYTATTDATGTATVTLPRVSGRPGLYDVVISYSGSSKYSPSTTSASIRLGR